MKETPFFCFQYKGNFSFNHIFYDLYWESKKARTSKMHLLPLKYYTCISTSLIFLKHLNINWNIFYVELVCNALVTLMQSSFGIIVIKWGKVTGKRLYLQFIGVANELNCIINWKMHLFVSWIIKDLENILN